MQALDLWIEYVYDEEAVGTFTFLINPTASDTLEFQRVKYTLNPAFEYFTSVPTLDIYCYLYDIYNVMVF